MHKDVGKPFNCWRNYDWKDMKNILSLHKWSRVEYHTFTILWKDILKQDQRYWFVVAFKGKGTLFWMTPFPLFTCLKVSKWNVLSITNS